MSKIPVPLSSSNQANILHDRKRRSAEACDSPNAKRRSGTTVPAADEGADKVRASIDENFRDVFAEAGMSAEEILSKKLSFKKGARPEKKLEEILPLLKQLRAVGKCLLQDKEEALLQQALLQQQASDVQARLERKEADWMARQERHEQYIKQINELVSTLEKEKATLQSETEASWASITTKEAEIARLTAELNEKCQEVGAQASKIAERDAKIRELETVVQQAQAYSSTLQQYNTTLQSDINTAKEACEDLRRQTDQLQKQLATAEGTTASLTSLLNVEKEQVCKLREEREDASKDAAVLRGDLEATRLERDRFSAQVAQLQEELDRHKVAGSKTVSKAENLAHENADLEAKVQLQASMLEDMRSQLSQARAQNSVVADAAEQSTVTNERLKAEVARLKAALEAAELEMHQNDMTRRKLHNTIQDLKGNIRVFCRVRPSPAAEVMTVVELGTGPNADRSLALTVPSPSQGQGSQKHPFSFDKVFGPGATQAFVYEEVSELVQSALDGRKVCIFAYGQTGSGKTFTMMGDAANQGIIPRAIQQVFRSSKSMEQQGWQFTMTASMLEIYNEEYRDLLQKKRSADAKKHQVSHDAGGNTTVTDLTLVDVSQAERVGQLLQEAMEKRSVGCTALNEQSSRSHMVFTLRIEGHNSRTNSRVQGVLNLIDLAGSERVKESGAVGARLKEAQSINKSLSALGDVIVALSQKAEHVPFRNSKLTWLLQPCLGGDAKTLMFVNINPMCEFAQESLCSLRFAIKVNSVVTATNPRRLTVR